MRNLRYPFDSMIELIGALEKEDALEDVRAIAQEIGRDRLELTELMTRRRVLGYCPMGCGETLYLATKGIVECASPVCPDPVAVSAVLQDRETEHLVRLEPASWQAIHPLRERIGQELLTCGVGQAVQIMLRDQRKGSLEDGTYRVMRSPIGRGGWSWERLDEPA